MFKRGAKAVNRHGPTYETELYQSTHRQSGSPTHGQELKAQRGVPAMSKGLSPIARKEWRRIVPLLQKLGVLSVVDGPALAAYCESFSLWRQAMDDVRASGIMIEVQVATRMGSVTVQKKNPAVSVAQTEAKTLKSFLESFGCTPAARMKVQANGEQDDDFLWVGRSEPATRRPEMKLNESQKLDALLLHGRLIRATYEARRVAGQTECLTLRQLFDSLEGDALPDAVKLASAKLRAVYTEPEPPTYVDSVLRDEVSVSKLVRQAVERHARDIANAHRRGLHFDLEAVQHVVNFFTLLKHSKGEWAGQSFKLEPWQTFIVGSLFGWKKADGLAQIENRAHRNRQKEWQVNAARWRRPVHARC